MTAIFEALGSSTNIVTNRGSVTLFQMTQYHIHNTNKQQTNLTVQSWVNTQLRWGIISYNSAYIYSKFKTNCIKGRVKCLFPEIYSLVFINGFVLIAKYSFHYSSAYDMFTWNCLLFIFHGWITLYASGNSGNVVKILLLCIWQTLAMHEISHLHQTLMDGFSFHF